MSLESGFSFCKRDLMYPSLLVLLHGDSKLNFKIVMIALMPHSSDVIYGLKLLSW